MNRFGRVLNNTWKSLVLPVGMYVLLLVLSQFFGTENSIPPYPSRTSSPRKQMTGNYTVSQLWFDRNRLNT